MKALAKLTLPLFFIASILVVKSIPAIAAQSPAQIESSERQLEREKALRKKIETEQPVTPIEQKAPEKQAPLPAGEKVLIKEITVTGVTLIKELEINAVVAPYKNKELTVRDMQEIADRITDIYRKKGFVTSRAYLPPQSIKNGSLEVRVIEGITGNIDVKGNRFFKSSLLKKKIPLQTGQPFNYDSLRKGLAKINQEEDRSAKAVLMPGKEPGTTDIVLEVKDRLPIHAGVTWDNFGSRYINHQRLTATVKDNNLLGFDDMLTIQGQVANIDGYLMENARYVFPVTSGLQLGFFALDSKMTLGKEFKDLEARGKTKFYSAYVVQDIINRENFNLTANAGFDYNDTFNFELEQMTSSDRLRVARVGLDSDMTDKYGRTFINDELDFGIPDIMGGLAAKDSRASRVDSGGQFQRNVLNVIRLQKMPLDSITLFKGQLQNTPQSLPAPEQFQIGGIANVRGYGPAESAGDNGYSFTGEWSFPTYFAKGIKVPFSKADFYDSLKWVIFYDRGYTCLHDAQAGEQKTQTLSSAGCGWRLNLPEQFTFRFELAWSLGTDKPSDNYHVRPWCEVSKSF